MTNPRTSLESRECVPVLVLERKDTEIRDLLPKEVKEKVRTTVATGGDLTLFSVEIY